MDKQQHIFFLKGGGRVSAECVVAKYLTRNIFLASFNFVMLLFHWCEDRALTDIFHVAIPGV